MENITTFSKKQINNFKSYEIIRKSGTFNMLDNQARLASDLTTEEYLFVMENFNDLREASQSFDANEYLLKQVDGN